MSGFTKPTQLDEGQTLAGFRCGNDIVDNWAEKHAAMAKKRGAAVVYVTYYEGKAAGFYTLSTHSVTRSEVDGGWFARNTPESIPAVLLGMLGADEAFKGMGLGAHLLADAIRNASKVAQIAGAKALIVEPADESAVSFYERFGFSHLPGTNRMALRL